MPLSDSLGSAQSVRLTKMNSVPTTEDLRYALAEAKKRVGKSVELPFDHPINHNSFLVEIVVPPKGAVSWSLFRGEGENAKKMWVRASDDVLMIQNKIKTESQYSGPAQSEAVNLDSQPDSAAKPAAAPSQPIILGGGDGRSMPGNYAAPPPEQPDPSVFLANQVPSFAAAQPSSPFGDLIAQPPAPAFSFSTPVQAPPSVPAFGSGSEPATQGSASQVAPPAKPPEPPKPSVPKVPLPAPTRLDKAMLNQIYAALQDPETGLSSFPAFVFFLFREFARYQKNDVSLAMVVFEVVAQRGGEIFELPQESLNSVANCIRSACSPLDIVAYVGGTEFAVLLASTDGAGALDFAASLNETLQQFELPQFPGATLLAAFGVGSIPETCTHPEVLVTAARQAKEMAKSMPEPYCLFPA